MVISAPRLDDTATLAADRQLHDAAVRALRTPAGRVALVLHLSRLPPPAPRPHHRRIARALLTDTAGRFDGQVFARPSGDLVLLCKAGPKPQPLAPGAAAGPLRATSADPHALPVILARLLQVDAPDPTHLVSVWQLDQHGEQLLAYAAMRSPTARAPQPAEEDFAGQTSLVDAIGEVVNTSAISDLMQRQTAILIAGPGAEAVAGTADGLLPIYREVTFSIAALQARITNAGQVSTDPFLFRHLATRLDQRMLEVLAAAVGRGGPLDVAAPPESRGMAGRRPPALHLNLTVPGILSPAFTRFAASCHLMAAPAGIEVSLIEAAADPAGFARARARVAEAGLTLVLDGVSHLALLIARPGRWRPDLLKLDWQPRLADLPAAEAKLVAQSLAEIGPERIILHRAETEAAMRWGMARGIRRFQGRHVDAMLGASRIVACGHAAGCTLRQCIERAAATGAAGRSGCGNRSLLDLGTPAPTLARTAVPKAGPRAALPA